MPEIETRTMRHIFLRLIPFLMICYFVAYLDRVNVSFASLTMNKDLGLSSAAYGFGAGVFFISYFLFEVPSNIILERVGARRWIARIMLTWGVLSGAMAFVQGPTSFYVMRFLLGAAEAGFFPGIIFYLGLWFPRAYRGRIITAFMFAIPLSSMIGSPISGALLGLDGMGGLKGWQWLYIIEAAPAIILSVCVFFYLTDKPADAKWLPKDEKDWLMGRLALEESSSAPTEHVGFAATLKTLANPAIFYLSVIYFALAALNYGFGFYAPQLLSGLGVSNQSIGWLMTIPAAVGALGMLLWGRRSDAKNERRLHLAFAAMCSVVGLVGAGLSHDVYLTMACLIIVGFGVSAAAIFWTIPGSFLSGSAAAAGIAAISSCGQFAGFVSPYAIGYLKETTGEFLYGLVAVAGMGLVGIALLLVYIRPEQVSVPNSVAAHP
uniref:MFS transporter n=1 Tax=Bosea sp. NBC_00436 TaxID=2969620 RepID=A0A9E8CT14_9HYPH